MPNLSEEEKGEKSKAPPRFELGISCLLDRRFNQLSHGANIMDSRNWFILCQILSLRSQLRIPEGDSCENKGIMENRISIRPNDLVANVNNYKTKITK